MEALELQRALLQAFQGPSFQRDLRELAEKHQLANGKTRGYMAGRVPSASDRANAPTAVRYKSLYWAWYGVRNCGPLGFVKFTRETSTSICNKQKSEKRQQPKSTAFVSEYVLFPPVGF